MPESKQLSVRMTDDDIGKLHKMAKKNNYSVAEQARRYILKGMSVDAYQQDEAQILSNMQTALREVLTPQVERIVKVSVKNSIAASVNLLYTSFLVHRIANDESRSRLEPVLEEMRRMGISFVQLAKGSIDEFLRGSMKRINTMWEDG